MLVVTPTLVLAALAAGLVGWQARQRNADRWLLSYLLQTPKRRPVSPRQEVHLILCIADHWEPKAGRSDSERAESRVRFWSENYPSRMGEFSDSDGRKPRHTFFYPAEEYEPAYLDALAELCAAGFGEVEVHLHHDADTSENFRRTLLDFKEILSQRHGLLARHRETGEVAYGFVHGNWALCNSRRDGRYCGVNDELVILRETGCYADFTLPSAPSDTQTSTINQIYYASDRPGRPRSHDRGVEVGSAPQPDGSLMLIPGPLCLDWGRRKWGLLPKLENGCLQGSQPPSMGRVWLWLKAHVRVRSRPDWFFVKLHAHGAVEEAREIMLGEPMLRFHRALAEHAAGHPNFHYHYVTAREMYNLVRAAEAGWTGGVAEARDYELVPGPAMSVPAPVTRG
jgi:hypothetical protein